MSAAQRRRLAAIQRLARVPGIGESLAKKLVARGIRTRAGLRRVRAELPAAARAELRWRVRRSIPRAVALRVAEELRRRLRFGGRGSAAGRARRAVHVVGGLRRGTAAKVKDIDLLAVLPPEFLRSWHRAGAGAGAGVRLARPAAGDRCESIVETFAAGRRQKGLIVACREPGQRARRHYAVDLFLATRGELPFALFHYTGSARYNIRTRAHAKRQGWLLNQYGLFSAKTRRPLRARGRAAIRTERDLARFLGVTYRRPGDRDSLPPKNARRV